MIREVQINQSLTSILEPVWMHLCHMVPQFSFRYTRMSIMTLNYQDLQPRPWMGCQSI